MSYVYMKLDNLLADDFLEFGSSGNSYDKKAQLEACVKYTKNRNSMPFTVTEFTIKLLASDVVLATYRTLRNKDSKLVLRSSIWRLGNGTWKMVFHQGTPTI